MPVRVEVPIPSNRNVVTTISTANVTMIIIVTPNGNETIISISTTINISIITRIVLETSIIPTIIGMAVSTITFRGMIHPRHSDST